jgi:hypothetical protein
MSSISQSRAISIGTMRQRKSGLEQLGADGNMELLQLVVAQRQRQEAGDSSNILTDAQIADAEALTGIKAEYEEG